MKIGYKNTSYKNTGYRAVLLFCNDLKTCRSQNSGTEKLPMVNDKKYCTCTVIASVLKQRNWCYDLFIVQL